MQQTMQPGMPPQQPPAMYNQPGKHSGIGTASLVLGILAIVFTCIAFIPYISFMMFVGLIFGIISLILGAVAYWGQWKDKYGLAGFILGLISIIIFVIILIIGLIFISAFMSSASSYSSYY